MMATTFNGLVAIIQVISQSKPLLVFSSKGFDLIDGNKAIE